MGNLFSRENRIDDTNEPYSTKLFNQPNNKRAHSMEFSSDLLESDSKKQKSKESVKAYQFSSDGLFEFSIDSQKESINPLWWETLAFKVTKDLSNFQSTIQDYDKKCANLISESLKPYHLNKIGEICVCPFNYSNSPTIDNSMKFSLENGEIIPENKYEQVLNYFKDCKSSRNQKVSIFESISGSGKTHFCNVVTQQLDRYCIIISPVMKVYDLLSSQVIGKFLERNVLRDELDRTCELFITSHIILLLMILQENINVSKRDFLQFQKNGGSLYISEIFRSLQKFEGIVQLKLLKPIDIIWCIDEAHIISSVLKDRVPFKNSINSHNNEMGSLLTSLTAVCRRYGPTFLSSTITGLIKQVRSDAILNSYSLDQNEKEFSLPMLWPIDSHKMLNQVMTFPSTEIALFVCNELMGPPRLTVSFFNMLVYEANKKKTLNVNVLLLTALYKTLKVVYGSRLTRGGVSIATRYSNWKKSDVWDNLLDSLVLFGCVTTERVPSKQLCEKLIGYSVCFEYHKSTSQLFLSSTLDKLQFIEQLRSMDSNGDWLTTLWNLILKPCLLDKEKLVKLLLTHFLIERYNDCILGMVLKDHPTFKHYKIVSKYWFHDIPFTKESANKNIQRRSTLLINLISCHFNIRTTNMKNWNETEHWVTDLPPNSLTIHPDSELSLLDFLIHPTTDFGPDLIGILVRSDFSQFLSQTPPQWIENDHNLPPYIPLIASCTLEREGEKLKQDILSATRSLTDIYSSSKNPLANQERSLIENNIKLISPYCAKIIFAPLATESLSKILNEQLIMENVKETKDDGITIMFSQHLKESFENYLSNETINNIINHLSL